MSADEIKALTQQAFVDGMACHRAGLLDMEVRCKQYSRALLNYASLVERLEKVKQDVLKEGDPWVNPRTRLWENGTYDGDGKDIIACRDIVHDLYELWFGKGGAE